MTDTDLYKFQKQQVFAQREACGLRVVQALFIHTITESEFANANRQKFQWCDGIEIVAATDLTT